MTPLVAGRCATCHGDIWTPVLHPRTGARIILWPKPTSRYPVFQTEAGVAKGIGYCLTCCPAVGTLGPAVVTDVQGLPLRLGPVVAIETAAERYARWYGDEYGAWLRAWLKDELDLDTEQSGRIERVMAEWATDRMSAAEERTTAGAVMARG